MKLNEIKLNFKDVLYTLHKGRRRKRKRSEVSNEEKVKRLNSHRGAGSAYQQSKKSFTTSDELEARKKLRKKAARSDRVVETQPVSRVGTSSAVSSKPLPSLQQKMSSKLLGAQFRWINEKMYTSTSEEANTIFEEDPELFTVYHRGFCEQVSKWTLNPLDHLIEEVQRFPESCVVADFGCGEARLAQNVSQVVHSFDLVAVNDHVTACDMSRVPLPGGSVDVGVFCLSLMGTNAVDFILEANRVLKVGGDLFVCEIISRIESVERFVQQIQNCGFCLKRRKILSKMFILFQFELTDKRRKSKSASLDLKPCLYKRR